MAPINPESNVSTRGFSKLQSIILLMMRFFIGWHFLYEGIIKLVDPNWSSVAYLAKSKWLFS